jgi:hypothetical protein
VDDSSRYRLPRDGAAAFFDFYATYALWWELGSGKEAYGHDPGEEGFHGRRARVDRMAEECAHLVAPALLSDVWNAAVAEASHAVDDITIPAEESWPWFGETRGRTAFGRVLLQHAHDGSLAGAEERGEDAGEHVGWGALADLFADPMWQATGYVDDVESDLAQRFGGPPWVAVCHAAQKLQTRIDNGSLIPLFGAVDALYDMGLGAELGRMEVTRSDLDRRLEMRTPADFLAVVSPPVAAVIRAAQEEEMETFAEGFVAMIRDRASSVAMFESGIPDFGDDDFLEPPTGPSLLLRQAMENGMWSFRWSDPQADALEAEAEKHGVPFRTTSQTGNDTTFYFANHAAYHQ